MNKVLQGGFAFVLAVTGTAVGQPVTGTAAGQSARPSIKLHLVPEGEVLAPDGTKLGGRGWAYATNALDLSPNPPPGLKKAPPLSHPLYGVFKTGPKGAETSYIVILDQPDGQPPKLYWDANHNGDLTDDSPVKFELDSDKTAMGGVYVDAPQWGMGVRVRLGVYHFDSENLAKASLANKLIYFADYAWEGVTTLKGKTYPAAMRDRYCLTDFSRKEPDPSGKNRRPLYGFSLDLKGDGKFADKKGHFNTQSPFKVDGATYELTRPMVDPRKIQVVPSNKFVADLVEPPVKTTPDLTGKKFIEIQAKAIDGTMIDLQHDYKGKVVLVDFWATWCGPCLEEIPNIVAAYKTYKPKGLEIVGLSIDDKGMKPYVLRTMAQKQMTWNQIYPGEGWDGSLFKELGIVAIPQAYLVDGDTGVVLAQGNEIRGDQLAPAIEKALAGKRKP